MVNSCSVMVLQLATISYNTRIVKKGKGGAEKHKYSATQAKEFAGLYFRYRIRFVSAMSSEEKSNWFPLLDLSNLKCGENDLQIASADVKAIVRNYKFHGCSNPIIGPMPTAQEMLNKYTPARQSMLDGERSYIWGCMIRYRERSKIHSMFSICQPSLIFWLS